MSKVKVTRLRKPAASEAFCYGRVLLLPAWVCLSIRLPTFSSFVSYQLLNISTFIRLQGRKTDRQIYTVKNKSYNQS